MSSWNANLLTITIWLFFKVNVQFELRETGTLDHGVDITPNNQQEKNEEINKQVAKLLTPGLLLRQEIF